LKIVSEAIHSHRKTVSRRGAHVDEGGQEIQDHHPERTQLTADQSAAVLAVLTDGNRVSVINAPAGSGKTWGTGRVSPGTVSRGRVEMTDAQPHRPVHRPTITSKDRWISHTKGNRSAGGRCPTR
jgi:AAA domain